MGSFIMGKFIFYATINQMVEIMMGWTCNSDCEKKQCALRNSQLRKTRNTTV